MPDIAMCKNELCADRHTCWRFLAPPKTTGQAYGDWAPDAQGHCDGYWPHTPPSSLDTYIAELEARPRASLVPVSSVLARLRAI